MNNLETMAALGTQDKDRGQTKSKQKQQNTTNTKIRIMSNPDTAGGELKSSRRVRRNFAYYTIIFEEFRKTDKSWIFQNFRTGKIVNIIINFWN